MNRMAVAEELVRVAEELVAAERDAADPWLTAEQVGEMCPRCAELMASKGLKRVRASLLSGKVRNAQG